MALLITTTAEIAQKMGAGVNAAYDGTMQEAAEFMIIGLINCMTKHNYSDDYAAGMNVDVSGILRMICSDYIAIQGISYDMSGYTSRVEAEDIINILRDSMLRGLGILRVQATQDFIDGA